MNIRSYVKKNWKKLPKSEFDGTSFVIVKIDRDDSYGYGEHIYEAWGLNEQGEVYWIYSSGCSCHGSVTWSHKHFPTLKALKADKDLGSLVPEEIEFEKLEGGKNSY